MGVVETTSSELAPLLERVKAATGPDRELDQAIYFAFECTPIPPEGLDMSWAAGKPHVEMPGGKWTHHRDGVPTDGTLSAAYTASIDAVLGLVERKLPGEWVDILEKALAGMWATEADVTFAGSRIRLDRAPLAVLVEFLSRLVR